MITDSVVRAEREEIIHKQMTYREAAYSLLDKASEYLKIEPPEYKKVENQVLRNLDEEIQTLSLEREDKHQVRLIKKLIVMNKEKPKTKTESDIVSHLKKIDKALDQIRKGVKK